jgi:RNA polymerase sigma factor (sigma-70 family)
MEAGQVTGLRAGPLAPVWRMLGDEQLARAAGAGNDHAFAALYARYQPLLRTYCASILLNASDADDAVQVAMLKAMQALPARDAHRPLRPWLYRIAHNEAINVLRGRRTRAEEGGDVPDTALVPGPETDVAGRERLAELISDLRSLPDRQSAALVMRELSGLDYREIGEALELTPGGARQAVFEARTALSDFARGRAAACTSIQRSLSDGDRRRWRSRPVRAHLRGCADCRSFELAIADRGERLALLPPFILEGATSVALAGGLFGGIAGAAGGGAPAVGALASIAGATAAKSLAGAAAVVAIGGAALGGGLVEKAHAPLRHHARVVRTASAEPTPVAVAARAPRAAHQAPPAQRRAQPPRATSRTQVDAVSRRVLRVVHHVRTDVAHAVPAPAALPAPPAAPPQQTVRRVQTAVGETVAKAIREVQAVAQAVSPPASPPPPPPGPSTAQPLLEQTQQVVAHTVGQVQQLVGTLLGRP